MKSRQAVIKGSSLPVLRIVVRDGDACSLRTELVDTIESARPLLAEAIAVLDLRERESRDVDPSEIVEAVRASNVRLAAVLIGESNERGALAHLDLPVIEVPLSTRGRAGRGVIEEQVTANRPETALLDGPVAPTTAHQATEQPT